MESNILMDNIVNYLDDKKARNIKVIDVHDITTLADYFIICTGTSTTHIKALVDEVKMKLREEYEIEHLALEGYDTATWILADYGTIILHVFNEESREFYNIERLWSDGKVKAI